MLDMLSDIGDKILEGLNSVLQSVLYATIYKLLYLIDAGLCWIVGILYKMFGVFAGVEPIIHQDGTIKEKVGLLNVLLRNSTINTVYWYMAMIGIVMSFGFVFIALIKKMANLDGKQQRSLGQILLSLGKSILVILLMTAIVSGILQATNVITDAISTAFNAGSTEGSEDSITYTEDQYAAMARVLNTIGNYSLNSAATSRYNINACYNDIRADLQWLQEQGVFNFYYKVEDANHKEIATWQSSLQKIVNSVDLRFDIPMDVYNENLSRAITDTMDTLKNNGEFKPLTYYEKNIESSALNDTPLDRILFLMGTAKAAKNEEYNRSPSITDNLRGPYYTGEKDIYNADSVTGDFDIAPGVFYHILIIFGAVTMVPNLAICVFNAIARLFNLLLLYLMAPLAISVTPLDDGGKFKQWTTAFVIQCFSILGVVISMRLLMLFMPLVCGSEVQFFENPLLNLVAKLLLLIGGTEAAKKSNGLITGILADNAGIQSIAAGDMSDVANKAVDTVSGVAADVTGISGVKQRLGEGWKRFSERGGVLGTAANTVNKNWGQTSEERSSVRSHEFQKRMGWDQGSGGGGGGDSGGKVKESLGGGVVGDVAGRMAGESGSPDDQDNLSGMGK